MTTLLYQGGDGIITFREFINLIDGLETFEKNERESKEAYNAFDFTGQGFIESTDILEALSCVLESRPSKELDDIAAFYELLPSRRIKYEEFRTMVMTWGQSASKKAMWEKVDPESERKERDCLYTP